MKLFAGTALTALLASGAALAEPNGWYGAVDAGWNMFGDEPRVTSSTLPAAEFDLGVENGWAGFGRIGYRFNPSWRLELEGGYRSGSLVSADRADYASPVPPTAICSPAYTGANACGGPDGDVRATTLMANLIYDFPSTFFGMRPYVGVGAGVNRVNTDLNGRIGQNAAVAIIADDSSTALAGQAIAGIAWAVSDRANIDLTYRYLRSGFDFETSASSPASSLGVMDGDYESHTVSLGLR
ncbi:MAG: outer membrane beta-barrel protein, partial [Alphaproteobacteria bacterium]|nr:outer membrane beta-barrel protein [Alphaproteobacteria bacterium]